MVVFELQFTAMQARDGGGEAQAQSRTGLRAALLQAHEALNDASTDGFGNTWPAIGNTEHDFVAVVAGPDDDFGRLAIHGAIVLGILDGIIDEVRQSLTDKLAIA